jgi:hypothetical protein
LRQFLPAKFQKESQKESTPKFCGDSSTATSQKESTPKFCGGSSRHISKRIHSKILWRKFPPHLKKNPLQNSVKEVPATSQKGSNPKFCGGIVVPLNLKKNPLPNSVEAVPAKSQKESTQKFCGGSYRHISKKNHSKILWRQFPPHLKKNPPQISVEVS